MAKKIHIIGGGIAGLSAGIFGRLNGFDTTIFEMNHKLGGVCTSWEREGYSVNGSIHWLVGSAPGTDIYDIWRKLGVIEENTFYNHSHFVIFRDVQGKEVRFYIDVDKLESHLLELAPEDETLIRAMTKAIRTFARADFPMDKAFELFSIFDWTKLVLGNLPAVRAMSKYGQISMREFAEQFQSPILREVFLNFWTPEMAMSFILMQLGYAHMGSAGYPLGGSGKFIEKLEQRYRALGGEVRFGQKVTRIATAAGRATGLVTEDGTEHHSDYVIAACDGHTVLFKMLNPNYIPAHISEAYRTLETFPSLLYFSAGIRRTFEEVTPSTMGLSLPLPTPIVTGPYEHRRVIFQVYNFDPTLAPKGKTLITAMVDTDFAYWEALHEEGQEAYRQRRSEIGKQLMAALEQAFPGIQTEVDFQDLATPITYHNWTGNHNGSYEGWLPTPAANKVRLPTHLKGLEGFYMAGHWVAPGGGMPPAAYTGRDAIQLIAKKEGMGIV